MRSRAVLLALLAVCSVLAPVAGGATAPAQQSSPGGADTATSMRVQLAPDGTAQWNVTMRFDTEDGTAFEDVAAAFESGDADVGPSVTTFEALAARGSDTTGRSMSVTGIERRGWRPDDDTGALTLSFRWNGFAAAGPERVNVSGSLGTTWDLAPNQRLVIYPPEGYLPSDVEPGTDNGISNGVLRWEGDRTFVNGQPRIAYSTTGGPGGNTTSPGPPDGGAGLAIGALVLVILAAGGYALYARGGETTSPSSEMSEVEPDSEALPADGTPDTAADADGAAEQEEVDETLLSDEERVERLLERNGGRMKQATIVEETGWSNAKVSQLLSAMADEGRVEKLRIGRENLISLPDYDEDAE